MYNVLNVNIPAPKPSRVADCLNNKKKRSLNYCYTVIFMYYCNALRCSQRNIHKSCIGYVGVVMAL